MGNKLTERLGRLRKQRVKWQREVESVESDWKECAPGDRDEMHGELVPCLMRLHSDIESSNVDDFARAELLERVRTLQQQLIT